ncbi:MAG: DinB family protein [Thermomicrobiales bacterium]
MGETLSLLAALTEDDLDRPCDHPCAMGGTVRDLLTHNIDHERMHSGQIYSARYSLQRMQKGEVHRLMAETLRARADPIASLIGLPDDQLDAPVPDDDWTIGQMAEHVVFWERHSIDDLARRYLVGRAAPYPSAAQDVTDPIYGALPQIDPDDHETPTPVPEPVAVP